MHVAQRHFTALFKLFDWLGIPTQPKKCKPPATIQVILGFEYNTVEQTVRIPTKKLETILLLVEKYLQFKSRDRITKKELLSLIGKLRWLTMIIKVGRAFIRRLELYTHELKELHHRRRVTLPMKNDLTWWSKAAIRTNKGYAFHQLLRPLQQIDRVLYTDASGTIGYGGFDSTTGDHFQKRWNASIPTFPLL